MGLGFRRSVSALGSAQREFVLLWRLPSRKGIMPLHCTEVGMLAFHLIFAKCAYLNYRKTSFIGGVPPFWLVNCHGAFWVTSVVANNFTKRA